MAPQRPKASDETRHDITSAPKNSNNISSTVTGAAANYPGITKNRRAGANAALKEVTAAPLPGGAVMSVSAIGESSVGVGGDNGYTGMNWMTWSHTDLHKYRHWRNLNVPSAFKFAHNQAVLSDPKGIGRMSPTMARPRNKRRVPKETLAMACRKDFNDMSVNEVDVVVTTMYSAKNANKAFKMKFGPGKVK